MAFSTNFSPIKSDLSANTVWPKNSGCKDSSKWTIFDELLSTQDVNVARFARNVECDFFHDFQPLCAVVQYVLIKGFIISLLII